MDYDELDEEEFAPPKPYTPERAAEINSDIASAFAEICAMDGI